MRLIAALLLLLVFAGGAFAQGCGSGNPNCIVPLRPQGESTGAAASTKFVQGAFNPYAGTVNFTGTFEINGHIVTWPNAATTVAALNIADQGPVTGGANVTPLALATGNITVDCGARPVQAITNGGAFTITAPANGGTCLVKVTNNATAGTITFTGFCGGSSHGDSLDTTNGHKFWISVFGDGTDFCYRVAANQ